MFRARSKFAPVVPIPVADAYHKAGMLGDYHLLLAHDVIKHPGDYHRLYCSDDNLIIMDNSVIELGYPLGLDEMREAIGIVHADVFVLPDRLLDYSGTMDSVHEALDMWGELITDRTGAMAVPQGANYGEWLDCVDDLLNLGGISWLGIPRNVKEKLGVSRVRAIEDVRRMAALSLHPDIKLHLLGFSDNLRDDVEAVRMGIRLYPEMVKGIDSAVPSRLGMRDQLPISLDNPIHSARGDWWDNPGDMNDLAITNVTTFRSWLA